MKYSVSFFLLALGFSGCMNNTDQLVEKTYADSLVRNFKVSEAIKTNDKELDFWKNRIRPNTPGISNELKYAHALISRFRLSGNIEDLHTAEVYLKKIDSTYKGNEAAIYTSLTETAILQHQFKKANESLQKAKKLGIENYTSHSLTFDVEFELGRFDLAEFNLNKMESPVDYGYHFRRAKFFHLNGEPDSATASMLKAAALAPKNSSLEGIALANAADFYSHTGNIKEAAELFKSCIKINPNDYHSIMGLGTIAMKNDQDFNTAETLFNLAKNNYNLPDPIFKLYMLAQAKKNKDLEKRYALRFAELACQAAYGRMYTKYLIELYTGILDKPQLAEEIARQELSNRSNPQTAAWYAWALYNNKKPQQAGMVYKQQVSGKPLEGFELFYMGKLMKGLNKAYTAEEFFKAADENKFDLSPAMIAELDTFL